ncbi:hypothetical protein FRB96_004686 [Tulasnella sp. 330]|nr:hypothetical protein FRB96_004686 [Tulasnella sp. 330]
MESHGNFDLLQRIKLDYTDVTLSKWRSRETGLSVVHVDYESPLVKGYFVVRTEIFDDSGCPHTLEHLVFLGSEKYPYKGVLDNLANRAFSAGTNAWTDTDHTAYTISTAGQDGFLRLLPVYVDHILYPTMTDNGFVTEVHHINSKAEDAGVVYAEMQGREQTPGDLMALKAQRLMYPEGSGYRSETGGLMEALRVLTAEKIRDYHRSYYVPHNLSLIVAGRLSTTALLDVLQTQVEPTILKHGQTGPPQGWKRPFMETPSAAIPKIDKPIIATVDFPEKDESQGEIQMCFVGPPTRDILSRKALDLLALYLTDSPVAPLTKEYVEIPAPLCTYIYFNEDTRASFTALDVYFGSVPTEHLGAINAKFKASLEKIVSDKHGIDMERMGMIIKRDRLKVRERLLKGGNCQNLIEDRHSCLQLLNYLDGSGGDYFTSNIIGDFLYGANDGSDLAPLTAEMDRYKTLSSWTSEQWVQLLKQYYIDTPPVTIRGKPSATLPAKLESEEKSRIAAQKKSLGESGLAKAVKLLEEAKQEHERPIPSEMLTSFKVPDLSSISWVPVESAWNREKDVPSTSPSTKNALQEHVAKDATELPFFVEFDHSTFVTINAYLSTADLPDRLRPHLSIYLASFYSLPVTRTDGTKLAHEEVIKQLDNCTVSYDCGLGCQEYFQNLLRFCIKVEVEQYEAAVAWLRDLIYSAEFSPERLEVTIAKVLQSLPEMKRDGNTVLGAVHGQVLFNESSTNQASSVLAQLDSMPQLLEQLKNDPDSVIQDFKTIRDSITAPHGVRFSVTGNILAVPTPRKPWCVFRALTATPLQSPPSASDSLTTLGKEPRQKAVVVTLPPIESSYALHTTKSISGFAHADHAALRVACEVLDGTESYLWRYIRGSGLAYGANMSVDLEAGHLSFSVYKAPDSYLAFKEARKVVTGLVDGSIPMDQTVIDGAKSSLVYGTARAVSTPGRAAQVSFLNQALKGVSQSSGRDLLEKMQAVTKEDVQRVLKDHVLKLFEPASSVAVVVSSPSKADVIAEQLSSSGFDVERRVLDADEDAEGSQSGSDEDGSDDGSDFVRS